MIKTIVDAHNPEFDCKRNLELNRIVRETYEEYNYKGTKDLTEFEKAFMESVYFKNEEVK